MIKSFRILSLCGAVALWGSIPAAQAEDFNLIQQRGQVSLGTFLNNSEMDIRVDGEGEEGTVVDWGREFGDKDVNRFRLDGLWRITDRHHVRMMWTDYSRTRTENIDQEIEWQGDTFPINTSVRGEQKFTIIEAAYEYGFIHSDQFELAASAGLHYTKLEASLRAEVTAPGGGGTVEIGGPAKVNAPLPVIGARGMWNIGGNLYLDAQAQFFALSFDDFDGNIINYRLAFTWQPKKYLGIGAGYDSFKIDVDVEKDRFTGSMDWTYSGPQVFFNIAF